MKNLKNNYLSPYVIFTSVSLIGIILFFILAVIKGSTIFDWLVMENRGGLYFSDYFQHVLATSHHQNIYENLTKTLGSQWGAFPPLSYVLYGMLYRMSATDTVPGNYHELMGLDYSLMIFLLYSIFVVLIVLYAFTLWRKQPHFKRAFICILCSVPFFAGALERGNSALIVFALVLMALFYKESDSKVEREIALILIAISASLKIYPAFMGFLYIKEKRYNEAFRLLGYGVIFFFVPFMFFGGVKGFSIWFASVQGLLSESGTGRIEYISGLAQVVLHYLTGSYNDAYASLVSVLFLLLIFVMFFETKDKYRTVFYLCALMTFFPGNAYRYTLLYIAIPLIMFLMERGDSDDCNILTKLEMVCYGCVFSIPTVFGMITNFKLRTFLGTHATYVELWTYAFAYFILFIVMINDFLSYLSERRENAISEELPQ